MNSQIDILIKKLCPERVEKVKLGEVCEIRNGYTPSKSNPSFWNNGEIPWFRLEDIRLNGRILIDSIQHITQSALKKGKAFRENSLVISTTATIGEYALVLIPFVCNQQMTVVTPDTNKVLPKFLLYIGGLISEWCKHNVSGQGLAIIPSNKVGHCEIPLPPLAIQQEIVNILDKFTSLIDKIDEEINLRQKQYEYYREKLLAPSDSPRGEWEWKTLPEISINRDRQRRPITGSDRIKGEYPYYGASGIVDYVEGYIFDGSYLLVSEDGANLVARSTPIAFSIKGKNWVNNHAHVLEFDDYPTQKIVEFYLNMIDLSPWISGGAQPKLNQDNLNKISIPIPSKKTQQTIVDTLDKFETLIGKLKEERNLRQKQYEYYREKLLTF